jgi:hypothetical protein
MDKCDFRFAVSQVNMRMIEKHQSESAERQSGLAGFALLCSRGEKK